MIISGRKIVVTLFTLVALFGALSAEAKPTKHGIMASGGYHFYMPSNYIKSASGYFDTDRLNGPTFELGYAFKPWHRVGFQGGIIYNRVDPKFRKDHAELRAKYRTLGLVLGGFYLFMPGHWFSPYAGGGIDLVHHSSTVELDSRGENVTAGHEEEVGVGFHARAGVGFRLAPFLVLFVEDRHSYVPIVNYAGADETFDVGGNFVQGGVLITF